MVGADGSTDECSSGLQFISSQWHFVTNLFVYNRIEKHDILDEHFFTLYCCKEFNVCLKKTKNKGKRGWGWPI